MALEAQDNPFTSILMVGAADPEALSGDADPSAGSYRLVMGTDDKLYILDETGNATEVGAAVGSVATDAIWDAANDLVVGSGANTAVRLPVGAEGSALTVMDGVVGWNGATSMPVSPTTGQRVWRSDLAMEFYFDGTRWLSTHVSSIQIGGIGFVQPVSATASSLIRTAIPPLAGGSDIWLVSLTSSFFVTGGTALGASHKWVVTTVKRHSGGSPNIGTLNIDSGSSDVWRLNTEAIGALMNNGTTHLEIDSTATKTGTPGTLIILQTLTYRIVGA